MAPLEFSDLARESVSEPFLGLLFGCPKGADQVIAVMECGMAMHNSMEDPQLTEQ
jgi:hypothetical protein